MMMALGAAAAAALLGLMSLLRGLLTHDSRTRKQTVEDDSSTRRNASRRAAQQAADGARATHVLCVGLALLVVPFLPSSNLFFPVGFTVAERIM